MSIQDLTDTDLLQRAMAGDEQAFTLLYRRRQAGVFRFALQMSGSRAVAEDVTQEVFMALMRNGAKYDAERGSLAAYLYGVARNRVLHALERERPENLELEIAESVRAAGDTRDELERNENIRAVRDAVLALPAHYREAVVLCDLHELAYEDAANALGCAVGTVRSRLHRARGLLAEKLRLSGGAGSPRAAGPARSWV